MQQQSVQSANANSAQEQRIQRRRIRRWKRRARIAGPFLGIPLLLAMLSLSVDLIEAQPDEAPDEISQQSAQPTPTRAKPETAAHANPRPTSAPGLSISIKDEAPSTISRANLMALDVTLPQARSVLITTAPRASNR